MLYVGANSRDLGRERDKGKRWQLNIHSPLLSRFLFKIVEAFSETIDSEDPKKLDLLGI